MTNYLRALRPRKSPKTCARAARRARARAPALEALEDRSVPSSTGMLNETFGTLGTVSTSLPGDSVQLVPDTALAVQPDGKIVAVSWVFDGTYDSFALARYLPSGALDSSFGNYGTVVSHLTADSNDEANAVAIQPDGKIVVAGTISDSSGIDFVVARYTSGGQLDTSTANANQPFGPSGGGNYQGWARADLGGSEYGNGVALEAVGSSLDVVVAGTSVLGGYNFFAAVRFTPAGSLDTTFGYGGRTLVAFTATSQDSCYAVAVQPWDNAIVLAGRTLETVGGDHVALARLTPGGFFDTTFGNGGITAPQLRDPSEEVHAIALQPDHEIVVAGQSYAAIHQDFLVARFTPAGQLDRAPGTGFGPVNGLQGQRQGWVTTDFALGDEYAYGVTVLSSGKIIAVGQVFNVNPNNLGRMGLVSYNSDGSLDSEFGSGGKLTVGSFFSGSSVGAYGVAVRPNGDVVVGGLTATTFVSHSFALADVTTEDSLASAAVFDWQYYLNKYPDLRAAGLTTQAQATQHWLQYGINEGRQGCDTFHTTEYLARYADLRAAFGSNYRAALGHYLAYGMHEGRFGVLQLTPTVLLLDPAVFDWQYYLANNPDLPAHGITTQAQAKQHWLTYGVNEGRRGSAALDPRRYLEMYRDLQAAFGLAGYSAAIQHYVTHGRAEGRDGNADAYLDPSVFDGQYYLAANADLPAAGITTQAQAELHWLSYGVNEGRRASATFSSRAYLGRYPDLQAAFGPTNWRAAIQHWITYGRREGRKPV